MGADGTGVPVHLRPIQRTTYSPPARNTDRHFSAPH